MLFKRFRRTAIPMAALFLTGWLGQALAATPAPTKKPPSKVSFVDAPSAEKPAAREKRLKRECKGRPNAGMCLGHTR